MFGLLEMAYQQLAPMATYKCMTAQLNNGVLFVADRPGVTDSARMPANKLGLALHILFYTQSSQEKLQVGLKPVLVASAAQTSKLTATRVFSGEHLLAQKAPTICTSAVKNVLNISNTITISIIIHCLSFVSNPSCWSQSI